ncbi:hypothetical protein KPH14_012026 [Odynerus spinipes]|uniref:Uncharacterized protein n=1 Tax=Odynerus spinipes TaxID=1348599 RepID=A0AAD9VLX5_9HYME|nr:hypothetical protein KPH14_012026 [Odynerus spinipes]
MALLRTPPQGHTSLEQSDESHAHDLAQQLLRVQEKLQRLKNQQPEESQNASATINTQPPDQNYNEIAIEKTHQQRQSSV